MIIAEGLDKDALELAMDYWFGESVPEVDDQIDSAFGAAEQKLEAVVSAFKSYPDVPPQLADAHSLFLQSMEMYLDGVQHHRIGYRERATEKAITGTEKIVEAHKLFDAATLSLRVNYNTNTPVATSAPLPTSTPITSQSPTPNLAAPKLEILSNNYYVDSGWFHIVGEVRNNSDVPMQYVKIIATLYNDSSAVVGTDFTFTKLDVIPPGGKSPFETGTDNWQGFDHYSIQVQGR
jgi:hypothetical protein